MEQGGRAEVKLLEQATDLAPPCTLTPSPFPVSMSPMVKLELRLNMLALLFGSVAVGFR